MKGRFSALFCPPCVVSIALVFGAISLKSVDTSFYDHFTIKSWIQCDILKDPS